MVHERINSSNSLAVSDVFQPEIVLRQSGVLPSKLTDTENEVFQSEIEKEIVKLFGEFDMMALYDFDQMRVRKVKELVEKYQTITQEVIVKLHENTLEVKSNELQNTKEELQLEKSINLTLSKRIQELEMAGNEVSNQEEIIESFDNKEVLEKCKLLEPLKCSKKGNAEEKKSVNKSKRKQSLQENENEDSKRKRKFRCDTCKKHYASRQSLRRHISSVHKGLKPFSCQSCNSTFANKRNFQRHTFSVHEEQRPFKCQSCEYTCTSRKSVHGENIINCSKCNREFTQRDLKKKA